MNLTQVKRQIEESLGKDVQLVVYGMRNKTSTYVGKINKVYPNIFSLKTNQGENTFTYADVCTGDIKIKYLN